MQGNKRQAVEESSDSALSSSSSRPAGRPSEGRSLPLRARYGINAWKRWALSPSDPSDNAKVKDGAKPGELNPIINSPSWLSSYSMRVQMPCLAENTMKEILIVRFEKASDLFANGSGCLLPSLAARLKSNLLSLSSEELNVALSRFVREVCRPSGERYSPDSILYLCLGIQQVGAEPEAQNTRNTVPLQEHQRVNKKYIF